MFFRFYKPDAVKALFAVVISVAVYPLVTYAGVVGRVVIAIRALADFAGRKAVTGGSTAAVFLFLNFTAAAAPSEMVVIRAVFPFGHAGVLAILVCNCLAAT